MRSYHDVVLGCLVLLAAASAALAQTPPALAQAAEGTLVPPPSWAFNDLACAPFSTTIPNTGTLRVLGSQDTGLKNMLGPGDTLVISGGSAAGLQSGQRYYVRRYIRAFGVTKGPDPEHRLPVQTAGWVQILGVDTMLATATILHACEGILLDDFLEPFIPPLVPAHSVSGNTPVYDNMGHIKTGIEDSRVAGVGQLVTIDRGGEAGVVAGQRFLVFRDKRNQMRATHNKSAVFLEMSAQLPLVEVGEVLVIAVRPDESTVQVLAQKDAIYTGDLIAEVR